MTDLLGSWPVPVAKASHKRCLRRFKRACTMAKSLRFSPSMTPDNPVTAEELRSGEGLLARLIAAAYAADHPESFGNGSAGNLAEEVSSESSNADLTQRRQGATLQASRDHPLTESTDGPSPDSLTRRPNGYTYS